MVLFQSGGKDMPHLRNTLLPLSASFVLLDCTCKSHGKNTTYRAQVRQRPFRHHSDGEAPVYEKESAILQTALSIRQNHSSLPTAFKYSV